MRQDFKMLSVSRSEVSYLLEIEEHVIFAYDITITYDTILDINPKIVDYTK